MTRANLVLWVLVEPWAFAAGLLATFCAYWLARPRHGPTSSALSVEAWRVYALVAAPAAFFVAAEAALWAVLLDYRSPLAFTGLPLGVGTLLVAAAPLAPVAASVRDGRPDRRALALGVAVAALGLALVVAGKDARGASWAALSARVGSDSGAVNEVLLLKGYRYVTADEARAALDRAELDLTALVDIERQASASPILTLDDELRPDLARRIVDRLADSPEPPPVALGAAAAGAVWRLTGDGEAALRAYALADAGRRGVSLGARPIDVEAVVVNAAAHAPDDLLGPLLEAAAAVLEGRPLGAAVVEAAAGAAALPPPTGTAALRLLLQDGSLAAVRPIASRFADEDDPAWESLSDWCPTRSSGLQELLDDQDPLIAAGASAVVGHLRDRCRVAQRYTP